MGGTVHVFFNCTLHDIAFSMHFVFDKINYEKIKEFHLDLQHSIKLGQFVARRQICFITTV